MMLKLVLAIVVSSSIGGNLSKGRAYRPITHRVLKKVHFQPPKYKINNEEQKEVNGVKMIPILRFDRKVIDSLRLTDPNWRYIRDLSNSHIYGEIANRNFVGISDDRCAPPDVQIAVGEEYIAEAVNCKIAFFTKDGQIVYSDYIQNFFANLNPPSIFFSDPKLAYDPISNRWIFLVLLIDWNHQNSYYYLAVSETSDPFGVWWLYSINAGETANNWADYPGLGFNNWGIFITSNQFSWSKSFLYNRISVLDKQATYNGTLSEYYTFTISYNYFSIKPAQSISLCDTEYLLASSPTAGSHIYGWFITSQNGTPTISNAISLSVQYYHIHTNASQRGGAVPLDAGDCRMQDVTYFEGKIYGSFTEENPYNQDLTAIRFLRIDPAVWQVIDDITYGSNYSNYFYPRVAVSPYQIVMVFARSGNEEYAGIAYTTAPLFGGTFGESSWLKRGESYYVFDYSRNRWGDYFGAYIDPTDSSIWIAGEYAVSSQSYGTWIGNVEYGVKGDVNRDGERNIFDVVRMVNIALSIPPEPTPYERWAADMNNDGNINILDVVSLVNTILNGSENSHPGSTTIEAAMYTKDNQVILRNFGNISGLQFDLIGNIEDITLNEALKGFELFSHNTDYGKKIIILSPRGEVIKPGTWSILNFKGSATLSKVVLSDRWGRKVRLINELKQSQVALRVTPSLLHTTGEIVFTIPNPMKVDIGVFDISGRRVIGIVDNRLLQSGTHKFPINVSLLASGVYFVVLRTASCGTFQKKFVVRK